MEYFAGLDVSMKETHVCVVDGDGEVVLETMATTLPEAIAAALAKAPSCQRVVLETGRMAPTLYHGLEALGVPVICIESRQAYLATHKTDRNDARGLAQLARTGFFKPVYVKSLPAHAVRALILARKKLVGQRVTLENQIRGLAEKYMRRNGGKDSAEVMRFMTLLAKLKTWSDDDPAALPTLWQRGVGAQQRVPGV
jgi:transposase